MTVHFRDMSFREITCTDADEKNQQ